MYSLTIVGGGAMSCGYDNPKDENILTHTHAALKHHQVELDSIVEIDKQRQKFIVDKWGDSFEVYSGLLESINKYKSDIFVVATPTHIHLKIVKTILKKCSPKLIICEKPIVSNIEEFQSLNRLMKTTKTKLITNFPRRFDPSLNILKEKTRNSKKLHFNGIFTKGLVHNGSHMIDLISMLVGNVLKIDSAKQEVCDNDFFGTFMVFTKQCVGTITNVNVEGLAIFELTIYTDLEKIELISSKKELIVNYIDKSHLNQGFKTYTIKKELAYTLSQNAYNTLEYSIRVIENDELYSEVSKCQYNVNKMIFDTQHKLMELQ